jgi:predicted small lipoprotein YifL
MRNQIKYVIVALLITLFLAGCGKKPPIQIEVISPTVVEKADHQCR